MPRRGQRTEASRAELPKQEAGLTGERSAAADGAHGAASQPLRGASSSSRPGEDAAPTDGPSRTPAPSSQGGAGSALHCLSNLPFPAFARDTLRSWMTAESALAPPLPLCPGTCCS